MGVGRPRGGWVNVAWSVGDFRQILADQRRLEADAAHEGAAGVPAELGPWVVCDTDALATVAWWERYLGNAYDEALAFAHTNLADLYLVTDPADIAFVQDGIRDGEHVRLAMHTRFCELAAASGRPWRIVSGTREQRVAAALELLCDHERAARDSPPPTTTRIRHARGHLTPAHRSRQV